MSHSSDWVNLYDMTAHYVATVMKHRSSDVTMVGEREERGEWERGERFALFDPKRLREPVWSMSCGAGGKPRSECPRGDVQLRYSKERAARRRKRGFEAGGGGWVGGCDEKGKRARLDE